MLFNQDPFRNHQGRFFRSFRLNRIHHLVIFVVILPVNHGTQNTNLVYIYRLSSMLYIHSAHNNAARMTLLHKFKQGVSSLISCQLALTTAWLRHDHKLGQWTPRIQQYTMRLCTLMNFAYLFRSLATLILSLLLHNMNTGQGNCIISRALTHWPLGDLNVILKHVIFNLALLIGIFKSSYHYVLRWMPRDLTNYKSTLVQVIGWCRHQAPLLIRGCRNLCINGHIALLQESDATIYTSLKIT